jgi:single-strand DNA-binding protein
MADVNVVLLCGKLTQDPQLKYTKGGQAVCEFGIAVNKRYRDKSGEMQHKVLYIQVTTFARTAENVSKYLAKGREAFIRGSLELNVWQNKEGVTQRKHHVMADEVIFMSERPAADNAQPDSSGEETFP